MDVPLPLSLSLSLSPSLRLQTLRILHRFKVLALWV
jgi:hypothetical protein